MIVLVWNLNGSTTTLWLECYYPVNETEVVYKMCDFCGDPKSKVAVIWRLSNIGPYGKNYKKLNIIQLHIDDPCKAFFMLIGNPRWLPLQDKVNIGHWLKCFINLFRWTIQRETWLNIPPMVQFTSNPFLLQAVSLLYCV